jgi:hypothetical protein
MKVVLADLTQTLTLYLTVVIPLISPLQANWHVPPPELFEDPRLKVAPRRKPAPPSE